jgi:serine/threonine protein kinase
MDLIKRGERRRANPVRSTKYYVNCQTKVLDNKNTREWLIIKRILFDSKVILGLLNQNMQVVIKIGDKHHIEREYDINQQLRDFKGFTRYICKFSCLDKLDKYIPKDFSGNILDSYRDTGICDPDGSIMTFSIIMPYYPIGNVLNYSWNESNFEQFKKIIRDAISTLLYANQEIGFLHNDLHLENLLLKQNQKGELKCDIIDFELSTINESNKKNYKQLGQNFRKLFVDINRLDFIDDTAVAKCIAFTTKMREVNTVGHVFINDSFQLFDISPIFNLIDNLKFIKF